MLGGMAAKSKRSSKRKTRRDRLIHNERVKLIATFWTVGAVLILFVAALMAWEVTAKLLATGELGVLIDLDIGLVFVLGLSFLLFMMGWMTLGRVVDPKQKPKKKSKKPRK